MAENQGKLLMLTERQFGTHTCSCCNSSFVVKNLSEDGCQSFVDNRFDRVALSLFHNFFQSYLLPLHAGCEWQRKVLGEKLMTDPAKTKHLQTLLQGDTRASNIMENSATRGLLVTSQIPKKKFMMQSDHLRCNDLLSHG